ncbi:MAG: thioredoxin domain-containing protein [Omnitrophica bacterium]|nr:thioredoxin domain-containing protein [Candidatus Omnitrophota bacterium]
MQRYKFCLLVIMLATQMTVMAKPKDKYTNYLINEKSPYLLQHAHNPVDWYPWGKAAFKKAQDENKPIFLSIGYSTCHWCHVMREESFSNPEIAQIMNKHFVSIKVDREERPDIDALYMKAVTAMTGGGGWPLTVFLTPDKKPFYGGTYFPPQDRWGRPGLKTLLLTIANTWNKNKNELLSSANNITKSLKQSITRNTAGSALDESLFKKAYLYFKNNYDSDYGGFFAAPKFPTAHNLYFLLRYYKRTKEPFALEMVEKTLTAMAKGGIYDHLGGGFHRYSTDKQWFLPHFEKMLYNQAFIARIFLEAYQITNKKEYARVAQGILDFVLADMQNTKGGFYTAFDADSRDPYSPKEKKEGSFYLWEKQEIVKVLGKKDSQIFNYYFGVKDKGNIKQDRFGEFKNKNLLYPAHSWLEVSKQFNIGLDKVKKIIRSSKSKLKSIRSKRFKPQLDDKILVDWNGLMISTFSFASRVLNEPRYARAAEKCARFILHNLKSKQGKLLHRWRDNEAKIAGFLADYAFFIHGLIDLYQATFKPLYLQEAKNLNQKMLELFWDEGKGGFFSSSKDNEQLLFRSKKIYDGAIPSGNSIAALDLIRLGRLTMNRDLEDKAQRLFKAFSAQIQQSPYGYTQGLVAFDFILGPSYEIVISGDSKSTDTKKIIDYIYTNFIPNKILVLRPKNLKKAKSIIALSPFIKNQLPIGGKTAVYVCVNYICKFPTTSIEKLGELLED